MAFKYTISERKNRFKGNQLMKQAVQINQGRITTREVAEQLQEITSLGRGDVQSVLTHLGDVAARYLKEGHSVQLGELGTFTPFIKCKAVKAEEKFTASDVTRINVVFRPSKWLREAMAKATFEYVKESDMCRMPKEEPAPEEKHDPAPSHEDTSGEEGSF